MCLVVTINLEECEAFLDQYSKKSDTPDSRFYDATIEEYLELIYGDDCYPVGFRNGGGKLVGVAVASFRQAQVSRFRKLLPPHAFEYRKSAAYLEAILVLKDVGGRSIPLKMAGYLENLVRKMGAKYFCADVMHDDPNLTDLKNLGFEIIGSYLNLAEFAPGRSRLLLAKTLTPKD